MAARIGTYGELYLEADSGTRLPVGSHILPRSTSRKGKVARYLRRLGLEAADLSDPGGEILAVAYVDILSREGGRW